MAGGAQCGRKILACAVGDIAKEHMGVFPRNHLGDCVTDAISGTGNDSSFSARRVMSASHLVAS